jgi:NAD(P)-dependent dehydrogenase (short-subunit alcohol dehydrogenase family)
MGDLSGKAVMITGGGRGQGRCHALKLAEAGADIAICDIVQQDPALPYPTGRPGDLEETARLVEEFDRRCLAQVADVRDYQAVSAFTDTVVSEFGTIDILVANHGVFTAKPIQELGPEEWRTVIDVNLTGSYNAIRAVAPIMIKQNSGRIIATSSFAAHGGAANLSNYVATKWGIVGLIKSVALDLEPHNITANAICPMAVDTPMLRNDAMRRLFCPEIENPTDEDFDRKIIALGIPKPLDPVEVSDVILSVLLLPFEEAKGISGDAIDVGAPLSSSATT